METDNAEFYATSNLLWSQEHARKPPIGRHLFKASADPLTITLDKIIALIEVKDAPNVLFMDNPLYFVLDLFLTSQKIRKNDDLLDRGFLANIEWVDWQIVFALTVAVETDVIIGTYVKGLRLGEQNE